MPMDDSTRGSPESPTPDEPITADTYALVDRKQCVRVSSFGEFPLASTPQIMLHVLTSSNLDHRDLARLEATCTFFSRPAHFNPYPDLSIVELAALDMCKERSTFVSMSVADVENLKERCGGSWKLVLKFLLAGEACRKRKSEAIAAPGHSIVMTSNGDVYSFGNNNVGQLGHGTTIEEFRPQIISSLQGICIIQVAVGVGKTILVSDVGQTYAFGMKTLGVEVNGDDESTIIKTPMQVDSLRGIFVVQAAIGNYFTAVLSRDGKVYTICWGNDGKLGHESNPNDVEPRLLLGELKNIPVVQIAAGYCYLLALACQPNGMSVYSLGCGLGGKLGHGSLTTENSPRLIKELKDLNIEPIVLSAGTWHAVVLGQDGRVCTWGWGNYGCLGHGNEDYQLLPKVVDDLTNVKVVHIATGDYVTSVITDNGGVYTFGFVGSSGLGNQVSSNGSLMRPMLVSSLPSNERVVHISHTTFTFWNAHTFVVTELGKLYACGMCDKGQLGIAVDNQPVQVTLERVDIDLS